MARTAGRSAEDTRRLILDTASHMIGRRGSAVPVSEIAQQAGVSKGGLLYHFATKEALLRALTEDLILQFREQVHRSAEEEARPPGGSPAPTSVSASPRPVSTPDCGTPSPWPPI